MISKTLATVVVASFLMVAGAAGCKKGGGGGGENGPDCESEFDKVNKQDKYVQCKACEKTHRGMGSMEKDCKNAIAKPWR